MIDFIKKRLVLYHDDADGFAAAYCIWKVFGDKYTVYKPVNYGQDVVNYKPYNDLVIVDFSYPRDVMDEMYKHFRYSDMLVLDHHQTAEADCKDAPYAKFEMKQSGCFMAWNHFVNEYNPHNHAPQIVKYIQDYDLWKFQFGESTRNFGAFIHSKMPWSFEQWQIWDEHWAGIHGTFFEEGKAILRYQRSVVDRACHKPDKCSWIINGQEFLIPVVNTGILKSQMGSKLAEGNLFSATYYEKGGKRFWSLRSGKFGIDVSEIAKILGGGGHHHAAGFDEETKLIAQRVFHIHLPTPHGYIQEAS